MAATLFALMALLASGENGCFAASRPIAAGTAITADDLAPAPCKPAARPPLRYDAASGAVVTRVPVPAGTYFGRLAPIAEAQIPAGTELTLRSTAGVVTIERRVTTMQPGRVGRRVFVRDAENHVFAVPLALAGQ